MAKIALMMSASHIAAALRLLESHVFGNGVVMLRYGADGRGDGS